MKKRENMVRYYLGVNGPSGREMGGTWPFEAGEVACECGADPLGFLAGSVASDTVSPESAGALSPWPFEPLVGADTDFPWPFEPLVGAETVLRGTGASIAGALGA
jgi:hypothetical protein